MPIHLNLQQPKIVVSKKYRCNVIVANYEVGSTDFRNQEKITFTQKFHETN